MESNRQLTNYDDDVYDVSFEYYNPTTVDPGNIFIIIAGVMCLFSLLGLPLFMAKCGNCVKKRRKRRKAERRAKLDQQIDNDVVVNDSDYVKAVFDDDFADVVEDGEDERTEHISCVQTCRGMGHAGAIFVFENESIIRQRNGRHAGVNVDTRRRAVARGIARETKEAMHLDEAQALREGKKLTLSIEQLVLSSRILCYGT